MAGTYKDAYAYGYHQRNFEFGNAELSNFTHQYCYDVDECAIDNGGCGSYVTCVNTPVSLFPYLFVFVALQHFYRSF